MKCKLLTRVGIAIAVQILFSMPQGLRRSRELTHRCSPKVDHLAGATMNGHARCPEETVPDLPTVVPARRESRRPPTHLR